MIHGDLIPTGRLHPEVEGVPPVFTFPGRESGRRSEVMRSNYRSSEPSSSDHSILDRSLLDRSLLERRRKSVDDESGSEFEGDVEARDEDQSESYELMGVILPFALCAWVEKCFGRVFFIMVQKDDWSQAETMLWTVGSTLLGKTLALLLGYVGTKYMGPKQATMLSCVWGAFLWFGIELAFVTVRVTAVDDAITKYPYTCLFYNATFAFGSSLVIVPVLLIIAGICHDKNEYYRCYLFSRLLTVSIIVQFTGHFFQALSIPYQLSACTVLYVIGIFPCSDTLLRHLAPTTCSGNLLRHLAPTPCSDTLFRHLAPTPANTFRRSAPLDSDTDPEDTVDPLRRPHAPKPGARRDRGSR
ncbi:putative transmembrane protein [Gregarina niphandrodes]|uniref:Transmembrane protein n=1 Tax=Gregarina niphandrodes TaxID=110365 RepID=A0A023BCW1_GRENI|nr:putative transmembrane protein [Gregarina niphandrodes]EZG86779.1 putative transmembrane protein [Gregarina niphandrodes]|eukprot:XP_011128735.1 putative transmembrane protein [Gregarina niphandrodes]